MIGLSAKLPGTPTGATDALGLGFTALVGGAVPHAAANIAVNSTGQLAGRSRFFVVRYIVKGTIA
ncbi:MAG: hypothetical protein ABIY55_07520 [Kofleriaceae bacterium]